MKNKKKNLNEKGKVKCIIPQITVVAGIVFLLHVLFISFGFFGLNKNLFGNLFIALISFLAFLSMFCLYKKFPHNFPMERKAKLFLLISTFLFFLGDFIWFAEEVFLQEIILLGGWPDLCWTLGYLALIISTQFFIKIEFRESKILLGILIFVAIILGGLFLYFDITANLSQGNLSFGSLIQDFYPIYDLIVFAMIIYLLWPLIITRNTYFLGWFWLGLGVLTRLVYDIIFVMLNKENLYYTGHPIDLVYNLFYIFIILNSLHKSNLLNSK